MVNLEEIFDKNHVYIYSFIIMLFSLLDSFLSYRHFYHLKVEESLLSL